MTSIFQSWIISAAISFLIRQLAKFGTNTDWAKVKADLAKRVADLVPGTWFDQEAVDLTAALVDAAQKALSQTKALETVLKLLAEQKWPEAIAALKDYLLKAWTHPDFTPKTAAACKAKSLVEAYKV